MAGRPFPWKSVAIGLGLLALIGLVAGYQIVMRGFIQAYYRAEYAPESLDDRPLAEPPPSARLTDVPWLSEALPLSQSQSLRMLLAQQGQLHPRPTVDFAMGATWGATAIPRRTGFFPGQDPEVGFLRGAPLLGFERRYYVTDDADRFLSAVRVAIGQGRAVRVALDRAVLVEQRGLVPHSVVLVGFDADGFEYYEPTCDLPGRCEAGDRRPGTPGLRMATRTLLTAEESQALALQYPWRYQLLVLEPKAAADAALLEQRLVANARALIGQGGPGPALGAQAVLDTAKAVERHGKDVVTPELLRGVTVAASVRGDDARVLPSLFPGWPGLDAAGAALLRASEQYAAAQRALEAKSPEIEQAVAALRLAAEADRAAGEALLAAAASAAR